VRAGHPSPIVPVVLGDEARALAASAALLERGLLVPAIRPPTVAPGTSRLRVALSAAHTDAQVTRLVAGLATLDSADAAP
jgi:8-amino-7-oxononanoate synthase